MRLLLDTHALLWWLADEALTPQARDAIADPANLVVVSAASAWEISIKKALGTPAAPDPHQPALCASAAPARAATASGPSVAWS